MKKSWVVFTLFTCLQWILFFLILQNYGQADVFSPLELKYEQLKVQLQQLEQLLENSKQSSQIQADLHTLSLSQCDNLIAKERLTEPKCMLNATITKKRGYIHPYIQTSVQKIIMEEDLDKCFYKTRYSGAIVYLGPLKSQTLSIHNQITNRTDLLVVSLKRLHKFYNSLHHYPIFVFHEDYSKDDMKHFREQFGHPLHFIKVNFDYLPPCTQNNQFSQWLSHFPNPIGYRQMCRFWSGIVQNAPVMSNYDYYLRLDDDTMMHNYVNYDLFEYMSQTNKSYIYQRTFSDKEHSSNLWKSTIDFLIDYRKPVPRSGDFMISGTYAGRAPYNNFHASTLDFWRSKELGDLLKYSENAECGFFQHAWGDANFHAVALTSLQEKQKIEKIESFPVQHNWNYPVNSSKNADVDFWAIDPDLPGSSPGSPLQKKPRAAQG